MHRIEVWLALPAQRCDDNYIGDIRLEAGATDCCEPVQATFWRPDRGGSSPQRLRYSGLEGPVLLAHVTEVVGIIGRDRDRRFTPPLAGTVHAGITLTVSDVDEEPGLERARLTVTPEHGQPFKYQVVWANDYSDLVDTLALEISSAQPNPWELLNTVCATLLVINRFSKVNALQYLLMREATNGLVAF